MDTKTKESYTIEDIINAGCNLEPVKCIHCGHIGEVVFLQYVGDAICEICGKWQLEDEG